jgi:arginine/ornithine N-succinyltransferase beta subunit
MSGIDAHGWTVAVVHADEVADLPGLDGHPLPTPDRGDLTWAARAQPGGAALATLRLRRRGQVADLRACFRLGWAVHAAEELQLFRRQRTLLLGHDLSGADTVSGFAAAPALGADQAVSAWLALLQMAIDALDPAPDGGPRPCIAQLPGPRDAAGLSPVWQGLGRHFHAQDLDAARRQHGPDWERHVATLLPRHLVYSSLLPAAAQAALGQAAPQAEALRQALVQSGFGWRDHVGLADGGPVLERWPPGF